MPNRRYPNSSPGSRHSRQARRTDKIRRDTTMRAHVVQRSVSDGLGPSCAASRLPVKAHLGTSLHLPFGYVIVPAPEHRIETREPASHNPFPTASRNPLRLLYLLY